MPNVNIGDVIVIALLVIAIITLIILIGRSLHGVPMRKSKRQRAHDLATDNIDEVIHAHNGTDDPTVIVFNRPELLRRPNIRFDVVNRIMNRILNPEFDDLQLLERIVNINEELDLDTNIPIFAPMIAHRIVAGRTVNNGTLADANNNDVNRLRNDSQNVHDPLIINTLRDQMREQQQEIINVVENNTADNGDLINGSGEALRNDIFTSIDRLVASGDITEKAGQDAKYVAGKMLTSTGTCSSYDNRRESDILKDTWNVSRSNNDKVHNIVLGLADSRTSNDGTVCINGRIARVLGANNVTQETKVPTMEEYRAEIYGHAARIMREEGDPEEVYVRIREETGLSDTQKEMLRAEVAAGFE